MTKTYKDVLVKIELGSCILLSAGVFMLSGNSGRSNCEFVYQFINSILGFEYYPNSYYFEETLHVIAAIGFFLLLSNLSYYSVILVQKYKLPNFTARFLIMLSTAFSACLYLWFFLRDFD